MFPLALASSAASFLIAQPLLHDGGYVLPAYPPVSITDPPAARAVVGTALLLTAYCLIALGIGAALRHSGVAVAAGIGLVFVPLLLLGVFPTHIRERIEQATPLAGMAVQSTTGRMLSQFADGRDADRAVAGPRRRVRLGARLARRRLSDAAAARRLIPRRALFGSGRTGSRVAEMVPFR